MEAGITHLVDPRYTTLGWQQQYSKHVEFEVPSDLDVMTRYSHLINPNLRLFPMLPMPRGRPKGKRLVPAWQQGPRKSTAKGQQKGDNHETFDVMAWLNSQKPSKSQLSKQLKELGVQCSNKMTRDLLYLRLQALVHPSSDENLLGLSFHDLTKEATSSAKGRKQTVTVTVKDVIDLTKDNVVLYESSTLCPYLSEERCIYMHPGMEQLLSDSRGQDRTVMDTFLNHITTKEIDVMTYEGDDDYPKMLTDEVCTVTILFCIV